MRRACRAARGILYFLGRVGSIACNAMTRLVVAQDASKNASPSEEGSRPSATSNANTSYRRAVTPCCRSAFALRLSINVMTADIASVAPTT